MSEGNTRATGWDRGREGRCAGQGRARGGGRTALARGERWRVGSFDASRSRGGLPRKKDAPLRIERRARCKKRGAARRPIRSSVARTESSTASSLQRAFMDSTISGRGRGEKGRREVSRRTRGAAAAGANASARKKTTARMAFPRTAMMDALAAAFASPRGGVPRAHRPPRRARRTRARHGPLPAPASLDRRARPGRPRRSIVPRMDGIPSRRAGLPR